VLLVAGAGLVAAVVVSAATAAVRRLDVTVTGGGTVTGTDINCTASGGPDCTESYTINPGDPPVDVDLQATGVAGWTFFNWDAPPPPPPPVPKRKCIVPKVAGKPLATAKRKIKTAHCRVGKVAFVRSKPKQRNLVLRTTPRAGKRLAIGAKVNLVVGRGR
jgi:hypothetical protein